MLLQVLCVFLLLNAFTQDVAMAQGCRDRIPVNVCQQQKEKGNCKNQYTVEMMKMQCPKTCGFCQ
ncbi:shTK domain protein [Ancylostoma caninum]|uniref:ShTK domain protein n=1 Tax=Ancylostoma caninum TaxID=29170 RepID=A0A368EW09_ANCCA|nr:shTK domain protein [Ancylostoma caninum]